ncbi:hypothetical protein SAMN02746066_03440 [Anaerosporobacter mobilis DSM 15930]|uniref:Uncharacterized protein n=1 Tax=Anaerosporobacter mobilis DSM 15930 TaxID=1120996 RepID=A0A1M7LX06_9FIRM|nr:hypothetical protein [Anaerosporobacter mobilis]SHM82296.1 hypothetical protein SAMN02746066_03440 [Anaerosporobacter mobilis DSM 15930]
MNSLNKSASGQMVQSISTYSTCWCVCVCLIFTEKRHSDLLDAGHAVAK